MKRVEKLEASEFDWDENKRLVTLAKSGVDFREAARALSKPHLEMRSDRGEPRIEALALSVNRVIVVIFTMRGDVCRIISAWPADRNEDRKYREIFRRTDP